MATKNGRQHGVAVEACPLAWLFGIDAGVRVSGILGLWWRLVPPLRQGAVRQWIEEQVEL